MNFETEFFNMYSFDIKIVMFKLFFCIFNYFFMFFMFCYGSKLSNLYIFFLTFLLSHSLDETNFKKNH